MLRANQHKKQHMINYALAQEIDLDAISELLRVNCLPYSDIKENRIDFIVARNESSIIGCIGLEKYGNEGLLRSFAVDPSLQKKGIGKDIFKQLMEYASTNQIKTLHLLTNTAEDFFSRNGFRIANRKDAPLTISNSSEFARLCPISSTYMVLDISHHAG